MLCSKCQQFCEDAAKEIQILDHGNVEAPPRPGDVRWGSFSTVLHHNLSQLKTASDQRCPICRIIYSHPLKWEWAQLPEVCAVLLEIKPRCGPYPILTTTIQANGKDLIKRNIAGYSGPVLDGEFACTLSKCAEVENTSTGSDASFTLARFWLNRCLEKHDLCSKARLSQPFMPSRVLDVSAGTVRLIETKNELIPDADKRFIALSHCWGKVQVITTTIGSLQDHLKGIQTDKLSQTFLDAITVTRTLSYRYLWIDSLCIIQDDNADWEKEAAQMCNVYQAAELTISAAHASDGNIGCFRKRDGILQLPFILKFPIQATSTVQALFTSYSQCEDINDPHPPLYSRAWVLQEQLLSRRMLIFDGAQLKWDCLCMHGSECTPFRGTRRMHHHIVKSGIVNDGDFFYRANHGNLYLHYMWFEAITDYTTRGMTRPSDRLAAIAGVASSITRKTTNQYLAGLWRDQLLHGLLWSIPHFATRCGYDLTWLDMDRNKKIRQKTSIAPSWSWASVTAPIHYMYYREGLHLQQLCKIQEVDVEDTAVRQTRRLQILGHTRVGYVNSVYPYAIREAAGRFANMQCADDQRGLGQRITDCGRSFSPEWYFLYSHKLPRKGSDWQLICGYWRPDEVLEPNTKITFIAVGQRHSYSGMREGMSYDNRQPLMVYTLGLMPTGDAANEYRRVGYGVWSGCAWYGYSCPLGEEELPTVNMVSWSWWLFWKVMENIWRKPPVGGLKVQHGGGHEIPLTADGFPKKELYHHSIDVRMESVVIV